MIHLTWDLEWELMGTQQVVQKHQTHQYRTGVAELDGEYYFLDDL